VSKNELSDAFVGAEVQPDLKYFSFSDGGPKAWFVVVRRKE
jgi:hypothetical protein